MRVVWSPGALRQVARAYDYLTEFNLQAAEDLTEGLIAAGENLATFPHRGRPVRGTKLRELVTIFPYVIRYRIVRGEEVRILRVRHVARRPTTP